MFVFAIGEEYLQHVLYERNQTCPDVVCAQIPLQKRVACKRIERLFHDDLQLSESKQKSTSEWQIMQITYFSNLRDKISTLYTLNSYKNEIQFPNIEANEKWKTFCKLNQPLLNVVMKIPVNWFERILEYLSNWLHETEINNDNQSNIWIMLWVYACLAVLYVPVDPSICSILREIAKSCHKMRESNCDMIHRTSYSLLICIISTYFGQRDLID